MDHRSRGLLGEKDFKLILLNLIEYLFNFREKGLPDVVELICDALNAKIQQLQEERSSLGSG